MEGTHFIDKEPNQYEALAELLKMDIQSMNEDLINKTTASYEKYWSLTSEDFTTARNLGYRQFVHRDYWENGNPNPSKIDILAIKGVREKQREYLVNLKNHAKNLNLHKKRNDDGYTVVDRIHNILKQVKDGYDNIRRHYMSYERVVNKTAEPQVRSIFDPSTVS